MKFSNYFTFYLLITTTSLFGEVQDSIIPLMNQTDGKTFKRTISKVQQAEIDTLLNKRDHSLRVMSFNMLVYFYDDKLEFENKWPQRLPRLAEYVLYAKPDIIGSQELQPDQIEQLMNFIGDEYAYYGVGKNGELKGDVEAIFYRKERVSLIAGEGIAMVDPDHPESSRSKVIVHGQFCDELTRNEFHLYNVHFAFGNVNERHSEALFIDDLISKQHDGLPIILTGDFNTFPMRHEHAFPFFDGDYIERILTRGPLKDSIHLSVLGKIGPDSTTNYSEEKRKSFEDDFSHGVFLDHIYVNEKVQVIMHAIDPAKVDNYYPSDHLPVIADLLLN